MRWPQRSSGPRMRFGTEVGYAPETPTAEAVRLSDSEDIAGLLWDVALSGLDFAPGHSIGVNYARTAPGWLLSPNFRPNEELFEVRYVWRARATLFLDARARWREDLEQLVETQQRRQVFDVFVRLTWQFTIRDYPDDS